MDVLVNFPGDVLLDKAGVAGPAEFAEGLVLGVDHGHRVEQALVFDPGSQFNQEVLDFLLRPGVALFVPEQELLDADHRMHARFAGLPDPVHDPAGRVDGVVGRTHVNPREVGEGRQFLGEIPAVHGAGEKPEVSEMPVPPFLGLEYILLGRFGVIGPGGPRQTGGARHQHGADGLARGDHRDKL